MIQDLARSNEDYIRRFEQLKLGSNDASINPVLSSANLNLVATPGTPNSRRPNNVLNVDNQREPNPSIKMFAPEIDNGRRNLDTSGLRSGPNNLSWLLQQYSDLRNSLLREVGAPKYVIAEVSRLRIKGDIVASHNRETQNLVQVSFLLECWTYES